MCWGTTVVAEIEMVGHFDDVNVPADHPTVSADRYFCVLLPNVSHIDSSNQESLFILSYIKKCALFRVERKRKMCVNCLTLNATLFVIMAFFAYKMNAVDMWIVYLDVPYSSFGNFQ